MSKVATIASLTAQIASLQSQVDAAKLAAELADKKADTRPPTLSALSVDTVLRQVHAQEAQATYLRGIDASLKEVVKLLQKPTAPPQQAAEAVEHKEKTLLESVKDAGIKLPQPPRKRLTFTVGSIPLKLNSDTMQKRLMRVNKDALDKRNTTTKEKQ